MKRNAAEWLLAIAGLAALVVVAVVFWQLFEPLASEARHWHELARQAAYGLMMLHMLAVAAIVRLCGIALERLARFQGSTGGFEDEVVMTILMWGAALPFILIGERFPATHAGGVVLGVVVATIAIVSARIARSADRSVSITTVWVLLGFFYLIFAHEETGDWLAPPSTAGLAMLVVGGAWELSRKYLRTTP